MSRLLLDVLHVRLGHPGTLRELPAAPPEVTTPPGNPPAHVPASGALAPACCRHGTPPSHKALLRTIDPEGAYVPPSSPRNSTFVAKRTIRVLANEFSFEPSEINIRAGERVNLELDNRGDAFPTLTISKLDFEVRAGSGKRASGSLTVDRPGSYPITCDVPGHADAGMRGTLIVEAAN